MSEQSIWIRRKELLAIEQSGKPVRDKIAELAGKWGVEESTVYNDWDRRDKWVPELFGVEEAKRCLLEVLSQYRAVVVETWRVLGEVRERGGLSALNGAVKNLRESVVAEGLFLQSVGFLPKVASEVKVDQKIESVGVKITESDADVLNEAARVLEKSRNGQVRTGSIH